MQVIADICVIPLGVETSVSPYIIECEKILKAAGLKTNIHAYGTNVEGDWQLVADAIEACHDKLHAMGVPRVSTSVKLGSRTDKPQSLEDKIASVSEKL